MFSSKTGFFSLLADAGPVVLFVLVVLLLFSVLSWSIIIMKAGSIGRAISQSKDFLDYFFDVSNIDKVFGEAENYRNGSLAKVFRAGYVEYRALGDLKKASQVEERISRAIRREANEETKNLSRYVPFLATVGNTAPFIGLFGTVWGIMNSFLSIGVTQSASLATVAPGIAEALVATAAGLAAAIPAVIAYNYFTQQINSIERDLEDFSGEFIKSFVNELG
ncbi:protein TolQ [Prosthecochloris sp. SCSIO W1101]|uniref:protein TolQ n=1 Tax=Prosthecochloris sp. SCSIO W1101 TaxID=2992242 RepID=UPI00223CC40C|nr:protein TolQ [Prosthecochloris sp. SCSIO W1101]UZJ42162.1 protein TolQ [Prosthecochloris sp. SCSIO W1101]